MFYDILKAAQGGLFGDAFAAPSKRAPKKKEAKEDREKRLNAAYARKVRAGKEPPGSKRGGGWGAIPKGRTPGGRRKRTRGGFDYWYPKHVQGGVFGDGPQPGFTRATGHMGEGLAAMVRRQKENNVPLVVSYGTGVDSSALLIGLQERGIRPDAIVFADVSSEKPWTYAYTAIMNQWLVANGMPEITEVANATVVSSVTGNTYRGLEQNCREHKMLPSLATGGRACSQKHKHAPQDKWAKKENAATVSALDRGFKISKLIGYDAGPIDARRPHVPEDDHFAYAYPLKEWGWDRKKSKMIIAQAGLPIPMKSACFFCPASKPAELRVLEPELLRRIIKMEANAESTREVVGSGLWGMKPVQGLRRRRADPDKSYTDPKTGKEKKVWFKNPDGTDKIFQAQKKPMTMTEYIVGEELLPEFRGQTHVDPWWRREGPVPNPPMGFKPTSVVDELQPTSDVHPSQLPLTGTLEQIIPASRMRIGMHKSFMSMYREAFGIWIDADGFIVKGGAHKYITRKWVKDRYRYKYPSDHPAVRAAGLAPDQADLFADSYVDAEVLAQAQDYGEIVDRPPIAERQDRLTIMSHGLGRDSTAMLCLLAEGKLHIDGHDLSASDVDAVVFSDTGAEWSHTYALEPRVREFCKRMGVRYLSLQKPQEGGDKGWKANNARREELKAQRDGDVATLAAAGIKTWVDLATAKPKDVRAIVGDDDRGNKLRASARRYMQPRPASKMRELAETPAEHAERIGADVSYAGKGVMFTPVWHAEGLGIEEGAASGQYHRRAPIIDDYKRLERITLRASAGCTGNNKISCINTRLAEDLAQEKFGATDNKAWGDAVKAGERPKHEIIIGIAADETDRLKGPEAAGQISKTTIPKYPLAQAGIDKGHEQPILERHGFGDTRKSGCTSCHFQPAGWYWALKKQDPDRYAEVVDYERIQIDAAKRDGRQVKYLTGSKPIPDMVAAWRKGNKEAKVGDVLDKEYGREKKKVPTNQLSLFNAVKKAYELFKAGPYIGPKGGKWADAAHTRPYKADASSYSYGKKAKQACLTDDCGDGKPGMAQTRAASVESALQRAGLASANHGKSKSGFHVEQYSDKLVTVAFADYGKTGDKTTQLARARRILTGKGYEEVKGHFKQADDVMMMGKRKKEVRQNDLFGGGKVAKQRPKAKANEDQFDMFKSVYGSILAAFSKAAGHKYTSKRPDGRGGWVYRYHTTSHQNVGGIKYGGLQPRGSHGGQSVYNHGSYGSHSEGKVFVSSAEGAQSWHSKVSDLLEGASDDVLEQIPVMIRAHVDPDTLDMDEVGEQDVEGSDYTDEGIPADQLEYWHPGDGWRSIKDWGSAGSEAEAGVGEWETDEDTGDRWGYAHASYSPGGFKPDPYDDDALTKAAGHKYTRRTGTPGDYSYQYGDTGRSGTQTAMFGETGELATQRAKRGPRTKRREKPSKQIGMFEAMTATALDSARPSAPAPAPIPKITVAPRTLAQYPQALKRGTLVTVDGVRRKVTSSSSRPVSDGRSFGFDADNGWDLTYTARTLTPDEAAADTEKTNAERALAEKIEAKEADDARANKQRGHNADTAIRGLGVIEEIGHGGNVPGERGQTMSWTESDGYVAYTQTPVKMAAGRKAFIRTKKAGGSNWGSVSLHADPLTLEELREKVAPGRPRLRIVKGSFSSMLMDIFKGVGHKYTRREGTPGNYRYYYGDSAAMRSAKKGDEIKLGEHTVKIVGRDADGLTVKVDGLPARRIGHDEWQEKLRRTYRDKYYQQADRRARTWANAVARHVPAGLLAELAETPPEQRLAQLQERYPKVWARMQRAVKQSGLNEADAKRMLDYTMRRRGWSEDARRSLLGAALTKQGAWVLANYRTVGNAAERLAADDGGTPHVGDMTASGETITRVNKDGSKAMVGKSWKAVADIRAFRVEPRHIGAAVELIKPTSSSNVIVGDLLERSKAEVAALKSAEGTPDKLLTTALAADALHKIELLAQMQPELLNNPAIKAALDALAAVNGKAPAHTPKARGNNMPFYIAGKGGKPVAIPGHYELVEAGDAIASHNPLGQFTPNKAYPEGLQERMYHQDKTLSDGVMNNANRLEPGFLINTNVDATNGPPMVDARGIVLGGNSRTMTMQVVYDKGGEHAAKYRDYLTAGAESFGLNAADVAAMKQPLLVRRLDTEGHDAHKLVRQMNESFTKSQSPGAMKVAMSRRLTDGTLKQLVDNMEAGQTLNAYLTGSDAKSFVSGLRDDGIIDERNENHYVSTRSGTHGNLNGEGRALVSGLLVGKLVGNADTMSDLRPSIVDAVAASAPAIMQMHAFGKKKGYDIERALRAALDGYNSIDALKQVGKPGDYKGVNGQKALKLAKSRGLPRDLFQGEHAATTLPIADAILDVLLTRPGIKQMPAIFRIAAAKVQAAATGSDMFNQRSVAEAIKISVAEGKSKTKEPETTDVEKGSFSGMLTAIFRRRAA